MKLKTLKNCLLMDKKEKKNFPTEVGELLLLYRCQRKQPGQVGQQLCDSKLGCCHVRMIAPSVGDVRHISLDFAIG